MGQRHVQLSNSYTYHSNGSATLHVAQLPPNPNIIAPGPALIFVVVNGVPSIGEWVMLGSGKLGTQKVSKAATLPANVGQVAGGVQNLGAGSNTATHSGDAAAATKTKAAGAKATSAAAASAGGRLEVRRAGVAVAMALVAVGAGLVL